MGICQPKSKSKNNNNKSNPEINKKYPDELKKNKNNNYYNYLDVKKNSLSKTSSGLNINQIGDINNYKDIKFFEQTQ